MRASGRYVANSPALRAVLLRAAVFVFPASALWALMPADSDRARARRARNGPRIAHWAQVASGRDDASD
jgi:hypothetical protein